MRDDEFAAMGDLVVAGYLAVDPTMRDAYLEQLRDIAGRATDPDRVVLAARVDGRVAGSVTVVLGGGSPEEHMGDGDALLRMLAVDPRVQGRGVGRALVVGAMDLARSRGRLRMVLFTQPVMRVAQHLYESLGFVRVPEWDWDVPEQSGPHLLGYARRLR